MNIQNLISKYRVYTLWGLFVVSLLLLLSQSGFTAFAQSRVTTGLWTDVAEETLSPDLLANRVIIPQAYRTISLNQENLTDLLAKTSQERETAPAIVIQLPLPNGTYGRFEIMEYQMMEPALAKKFPQLKTYLGHGLDDPTATVRFDWTPHGFHAMILSTGSTVYIDPYSQGNTQYYISYYKDDYQTEKTFEELPPLMDSQQATEIATIVRQLQNKQLTPTGDELRTYRLALAATGEYSQYHGGTVNDAMNAIVTTMNRVNGVYELDVAVRMVLIGNNDLIIYLNGATDPYTNNSGGAMLGENQANLDAVIGNANYDIGHVFSTGGGGVASLGVPCITGSKARGVTGSSNPIGDAFDIDYVAHEMGHQFGANHTFNGNTGACTGSNRNGPTAYEPGSATTIMGYAGICSPQDIQPHSDDMFHAISIDEIVAYTQFGGGNNCPNITLTGNSAPVVNAGSDYTIPKNTPFTLAGSATDPDADPLTYSWEEFDLGPAGHPNSPSGNAPIFRTFKPVTSPARTFPQISDIVNNTQTIGEILPGYGRTMNFRLVVRDNNTSPSAGGVDYDTAIVTVDGASGPFSITAPNTNVTWPGGSAQTVTWNVANTDAGPVSCAMVDILLSTDGGYTTPTTLLTSTINNGSAIVTLPNIDTSTARIKVACSDNIFFDISNTNFTITFSAGVIANPDQLTISEPDESATTTLTLLSEPTDAVTITLTTSNSECSVLPPELVLDSSTWSTGRIITTTAVDDNLADGSQPCLIQGNTVSNDSNYNNLTGDYVTVTVLDNETVDLAISKTVWPVEAAPGEAITYTLTYSNVGAITATTSLISDIVPISLTNITVTYSGVSITDTGTMPAYVWQTGSIAPGQLGMITLTGGLAVPVGGDSLLNTAWITPVTTDTNLADNSSSVSITLVNSPPWLIDDTANTLEDNAVVIDVLANDQDPNLDSLFITAIGSPANGEAVIGTLGETIIYTPSIDFNGSDSFTYTASDGEFEVSAWLTVTVQPVNDAPVFTPGGDVVVAENSGVYSATWATDIMPGPPTASDEVNQTVNFILAYTNNGLFSQGLAISPDGFLSFEPAPNTVGLRVVTVYLQDNGGAANGGVNTTSGVPFTITVVAVNDAPVALADSYEMDEDATLMITTTGVLSNDTDAEGDVISATIASPPGGGEVWLNLDGSFTYTPTVDFNGQDSFEYMASDGTLSATATVTITVNPINDAPQFTAGGNVIVSQNIGVYNATWATNVAPGPTTASDEVTQTVAFTLSHTNPALFTQVPAMDETGNLSFSPATAITGTSWVTVTLWDDGGTSNGGVDTSESATFSITIVAINTPPVAVSDVYTIAEDNTLIVIPPGILSNDSDPENGGLSAMVETAPTGNLVLDLDGSFSYTPIADFNGADTFTYLASDGELSATATVTINITAVNDTPLAEDDTATTEAETAIFIAVLENDSDLEGDTLSVSAVSDPLSGSTTISGTGILYTPTANFSGTETFSYTVSDGDLTDTALVTVTVNGETGMPALTLVKSVASTGGTLAVPLDGVVTYTLNLSNVGTGLATTVTINDPLPAQVSFGDWVVQNNATLSGTTIMWGPGDIAPETSEIIIFTVVPGSGTAQFQQTITNTAWYSSTNAGSGSASATFTTATAPERGFILYLPLVLK